MEVDSEQSYTETAARWNWSLPEEECLIRLIKKHKKRVEDGENPKGNFFDEVSIELNELGFGIQRTGTACDQKWRRICNKNSMLRAADAWKNDQDIDADFGVAEHSTTYEDEADGGFTNMVDENPKRFGRPWTEEESRILYEEIKTFTELRAQGGLPKSTAVEIFNHVTPLLKVKGYVRTPKACQQYWRSTGSELWSYHERAIGDFKLLDMRTAKSTKSSSEIDDGAVVEGKHPRGTLTKEQKIALSQLAEQTLSPTTEQEEKLMKDHSISAFQISTYFANKRSSQKKETARNELDQENSKRKQFERLFAEIADGNESVVARTDRVSRNTKRPRLSSYSQIAFNSDESSAQLRSSVEEDYIRKPSTSPPLPIPDRLHTSNTEFVGLNAPIEINSSPLRPENAMEDTPSSDDEAGFKEMQEMVLVQRRRIEERIAASIDRRKQLQLETIRHQTRADMEREAAEGTQKKVDEELRVEARLRTRLNQIGSL
ncbi:hypothetical protein BOTCAL_0042g00180 [Botryotinia calthae]|uniref:Homeobox domain-containing protein n=1 Tax=Botryotinia calthae TaxID=38488 RepID=A0A4Y8DBY6_9HELO|nr:hypothetical protein BOTCAL_0042g00180 [Botryotinia calthae]